MGYVSIAYGIAFSAIVSVVWGLAVGEPKLADFRRQRRGAPFSVENIAPDHVISQGSPTTIAPREN